MGNVDISSVGTESVNQTGQAGRTECLAGVSREGLTREIFARHNCLHLAWLFAFQSCARHMLPFMGCLVTSYPRNLFSLQLLESSHSLSNTQPLQWNPTINTGYKRLNNITIKFGTKYKPTKHNVVNNNFTKIMNLLGYETLRCTNTAASWTERWIRAYVLVQNMLVKFFLHWVATAMTALKTILIYV